MTTVLAQAPATVFILGCMFIAAGAGMKDCSMQTFMRSRACNRKLITVEWSFGQTVAEIDKFNGEIENVL